MATVDNSTQLITSTESGTGWSVDVTNANLDPDLTLKDFIVKFDGVVQNNADFTKTSQTIITYNGVALGSPTEVVIARDTPNDRVKCLTFGDRLQSSTYEAEFNRVHKLINDSEIEISQSTNVKVTVDDTTPGTLANKLAEGNDITLTVLNPGANEQLRIDAALNVTGEPYVDINSVGSLPVAGGNDAIAIGENAAAGGTWAIAIGENSTATVPETVAIGRRADAPGSRAIAIGKDTEANAESVAIGDFAVASGLRTIALGNAANATANDTVQLSTGTNNTASTLQFLTNTLANAQGLFTSFTTPVNYTPADTDNITSHLQAIDTALAGGGGGALVNQDITSAIDITVTPGVSNDRLFITPTANINLILLTAGAANTTHFTFVNLDPGSFNIDVKIDLVGNPTILTLGGGLTNVSVGYTGTDYRFYG